MTNIVSLFFLALRTNSERMQRKSGNNRNRGKAKGNKRGKIRQNHFNYISSMLRSWEQLWFIYHKRLERSKLDRQNRSTYSNFRLIALARVAQSFRGLGFAKSDNQKDAQISASHVCINSFQLNMAEAKKSPSRTRWGTSDDRTQGSKDRCDVWLWAIVPSGRLHWL